MRTIRAATLAVMLGVGAPPVLAESNAITLSLSDASQVRPRNVTVEAVRYGGTEALEVRQTGQYRGFDTDTFAFVPGLDFHDGTIEVERLTNVLWIVDVNRQSLDRIVPDGRLRQMRAMFDAAGWHVIELAWGRKVQKLFAKPGGEGLRAQLDAMSNLDYQRLLRLPVLPEVDHPDVALVLQRLAGLCATVIEFTSLPDDDRPGAEDENFFKVGSFWHDDGLNGSPFHS